MNWGMQTHRNLHTGFRPSDGRALGSILIDPKVTPNQVKILACAPSGHAASSSRAADGPSSNDDDAQC